MCLWLLKPREGAKPWEPWHNKTFGFVIRASSETEARSMAQEKGSDECDHLDAWTNESLSTCEVIPPDGEPGVILQDTAEA